MAAQRDRRRCLVPARPPRRDAAARRARCRRGRRRPRPGAGRRRGVDVCACGRAPARRARRGGARRATRRRHRPRRRGAPPAPPRAPRRRRRAAGRRRRAAHAGCVVGLRIGRDLEHQLLGLVAEREPHAVGLHLGDQHAVDRVALQHAARLAAGDLAQERRVLAVDRPSCRSARTGRAASAASPPRPTATGAGRRVGLNSVRCDRLACARRRRRRSRTPAAATRPPAAARSALPGGGRLRDRAAPVGLPADAARAAQQQRHEPPRARRAGGARSVVHRGGHRSFLRRVSANVEARPTSSCTLISGSWPGGRA